MKGIEFVGIPCIVEVKRSSDTRIRREVVGQMLDYAANAVLYWPVESLRALFEARREKAETDTETAVAARNSNSIGGTAIGGRSHAQSR